MKVLITGITGAVGPRIAERLVAEGYKIHGLSRTGRLPPEFNHIAHRVTMFTGDITNESDVYRAVKDCEVVIHLAALLHIINPPDSLKRAYQHTNVEGTRIVVDVACKARVKRIIYFSTINVYGDTEEKIVSETTPPKPLSKYAQTKLAGEKHVREANSHTGEPIGIILRLGAIYGSHIKGNYSILVDALQAGKFVPIGKGENRRSLIYDKDVAKATLLTMTHPNAIGKLYNLTDGSFHTVSQIVQAICYALGRRPPRFNLPISLAYVGARVLKLVSKVTCVRSPIKPETIDKYTEDVAVDSRLIQQELGFQPDYDLISGWEDALKKYDN